MNETALDNRHVLITGGTIGTALAHALAEEESIAHVRLAWRSNEPDVSSEKIEPLQLDLLDEAAVAAAIAGLDRLDGVIDTTGVLHGEGLQPEKTVSNLDVDSFEHVMRSNALPTLILAKHCKRLLRESPDAWFASLSAKVGSITDNHLGGWYSYRASKAALNMVLKTLAIEWRIALPRCTVAALHPGTVISPLSRPFTHRTDPDRLFTPDRSARYLKGILFGLTPAKSGRFWSWDGSEIPW